MPQLDTIFILLIFQWVWLMLYLMVKKTTSIQPMVPPKNRQNMKTNEQTPLIPWM